MKAILYVLMYAAFNVSGAALIKWQLKGRSLTTFHEWLRFLVNPPFMVAFMLIVFSALSLFKALSASSFSLIIPLANGVNFILTICVGYYFFQDKLSLLSFLGFLLIISGIVVLSINNHSHA